MIGELAGPHWYVGSSTRPTSITPRSARHFCTPSMSKQKSPSESSSATMTRPSVAGVAEACEDLTCRFIRGTPWYTALSHTMRPLALSMASSRHVWLTMSLAGAIPALLMSPAATITVPLDGTAVVT